MREGRLKTPVVFIVVGEPGTGKSWFANKLSIGLDIFGIDYERLRYYLFNEASYNDKEMAVMQNTASYIMDELFAHNQSFVIDGGGNDYKFRREMAKKCDEKGYEQVIVWLQANSELSSSRATGAAVIKAKYFKRKLTTGQLTELAKQFEKPTDKEDVIVISGNHSFQSQMKVVLTNMHKRKLLFQTPQDTYKGLSKPQSLPSDERRNRMRYI